MYESFKGSVRFTREEAEKHLQNLGFDTEEFNTYSIDDLRNIARFMIRQCNKLSKTDYSNEQDYVKEYYRELVIDYYLAVRVLRNIED